MKNKILLILSTIIVFAFTSGFILNKKSRQDQTKEVLSISKNYYKLIKKSKKESNSKVIHKANKIVNFSFSKEKTYSSEFINVGVLANSGYCGQDPKLQIELASGPKKPYTIDYTGYTKTDGMYRITLRFCIIQNTNYFNRTSVDYGLLRLDADLDNVPDGVSVIKRSFTETLCCASFGFNTCVYNGDYDGLPADYYPGAADFGDYSTYLTFYQFHKNENGVQYPFHDFGYDYAVLGRFGKHQGVACSRHGVNSTFHLHQWDENTGTHTPGYTISVGEDSFSELIVGPQDNNFTYYFISKVVHGDCY